MNITKTSAGSADELQNTKLVHMLITMLNNDSYWQKTLNTCNQLQQG